MLQEYKVANVNTRLKEGQGLPVAYICAFHEQLDYMREVLLEGEMILMP